MRAPLRPAERSIICSPATWWRRPARSNCCAKASIRWRWRRPNSRMESPISDRPATRCTLSDRVHNRGDNHHEPGREGEATMASDQLKLMNDLYASIKERVSKRGLDLATNRDIVENLHLAAIEPEAVTYAEVDAGGVPAMWCIPQGSDTEHVLLHSHNGGTVVLSMHSDRKPAGHIAKATGVRALVVDFRRSPEHKFPAQTDDMD